MKLSVHQVARLIAVRSDPLEKAIYAVLGAAAKDAEHSLTQVEADAMCAHLDAQHAANERELPDAEIAEALGRTPNDLQYEAAREIGEAVTHLKALLRLAGLDVSREWAELALPQ